MGKYARGENTDRGLQECDRCLWLLKGDKEAAEQGEEVSGVNGTVKEVLRRRQILYDLELVR